MCWKSRASGSPCFRGRCAPTGIVRDAAAKTWICGAGAWFYDGAPGKKVCGGSRSARAAAESRSVAKADRRPFRHRSAGAEAGELLALTDRLGTLHLLQGPYRIMRAARNVGARSGRGSAARLGSGRGAVLPGDRHGIRAAVVVFRRRETPARRRVPFSAGQGGGRAEILAGCRRLLRQGSGGWRRSRTGAGLRRAMAVIGAN